MVVICRSSERIDELLSKYRFKGWQEYSKLDTGTSFALKKIKLQENLIYLQLWSVNIGRNFQSLIPLNCVGANGAIIMYDISDTDAIIPFKDWIQVVRDRAGNIPIVLVGNENDLRKTPDVSLVKGVNLVKKYSLLEYLEISTDTGKNVEKMFETITNLMVNRLKMIDMGEKDIDDSEEYKKRIKELIERVEKGENSPEMYQQLLDKLGQVKQKAIAITNKKNRNEKSIFGFVFVLREYYWLRDDPRYPFKKDQFPEEIDALYKLIYKELKKRNQSLPGRFDIDNRKKILRNMRVALGSENITYFCKKYKIDKLIRIDPPMKKWEENALCFICIAIVILFTIFFIQRL